METIMGKKVEQLLHNESFAETVENCTTTEDVRRAFEAEGVQMNDEQFTMLMEALEEAALDAPAGELSDSELGNVSGGVSVKDTLKWMINGFKWGWKWGDRFYEWEQSLYK